MKPGDSRTPRPAAKAAREAGAADWLVRRARGLSAAETAEFERWRAADPRHAEIFTELEEAWRALDALDQVTLPDGRALDYDLPPAAAPAPRAGWAAWRWPAWTLAAAALAMAGWFGLRSPAADRGLRRAVATQTGELEKIDLPDGSVIHVNTDSAVAIAFTAQERRVELSHGEASFTVAKDPARPFIVTAGGVDVRAIGTVFDVRFQPEAVDVLVTEGKVRVDDSAQGRSLLADAGPAAADGAAHGATLTGPLLLAGQRATIRLQRGVTAPAAVTAVTAEEASHELAWQERRLEFFDTPLPDAVAEFNRYNRHKLVIVDAALADRRFGGSIRADNGDAFVRVLESRFGIVAEQRENETLLRATR